MEEIRTSEGYWRAEKFWETLEPLGLERFRDAAQALVQRRRDSDFVILPGIVRCRLQDEKEKTIRVSLEMDQISDDGWHALAESFAAQALFVASFLAGEIPEEAMDLFERHQSPLLPSRHTELTLRCECSAKGPCVHRAALCVLAADHFVNDPFSLFVWRGRTRDQLLSEIHRVRAQLRQRLASSRTYSDQVSSTADDFWRMKPAVKELRYTIKADELPASLLRRLDAIPLGELQFDFERELEEAYARVARRAQALGLGL